MTTVFHARFAGTSALAAIAAALALAGCNPKGNDGRDQAAYQLPALPATLPLAPGGTTAPAYAPAAALLPVSRQIGTARVADPRDDYAYADDAWGFADAVGDAPPDYGFYYDDVEPWAWQGYDNSVEFVEPLGSGYRYYYYRPGADTPYFVRDPDYGYGYDGGQLTVVYGPDGRIIPDRDYGPRLDYASRYYARGRALYGASHERRPVVAANWAARQNAIVDTQRWAAARAAQPAWQQYHQRTAPQQARHWDEEQARRRADTVRFTAWQGNDFRTPPPPRAIPQAWTQASWAHDDHRFAPPAAGFNGDAAARQHAAQKEREAIAAQARPQNVQEPPGARPGTNLQQQQPQPQGVTGRREAQHVPFGPGDGRQRGADMPALQQAERALQAQRQQQDQAQRQQAAAQQAAARQQQDRAAASARQAQQQAQQQGAAQARERAQDQARAQQAAQQQAQARLRGEAQAQQRAQAERRQSQQRAEQQAQAQQRQAAQAQQRAQLEAQQRGQAQAQAQQRQAQQRAEQAQAQPRAQAQAQAQQRQAVQAQQRAEMQAHQRPPAPSAPANHPNPGDHKHEPH